MGLLDDAIREHLELKRRRGADPTELERQEREALGPVRRPPQEAREVLLDEPPEREASFHDEEAEPEWSDRLEAEPPFDHGFEADLGPEPAIAEYEPELDPRTEIRYRDESAPPAEPAAAPERAEYEPPRHREIAEEWEAHQRQPSQAEGVGLEPQEAAPTMPPPAPAGPPPAQQPPPSQFDETAHIEQETAEYDVEAARSEDPEAEDMLEETPEFLQDTPDHDRLWFEQRPPRDFDLDS
jgi:hypothetical protein